MPSRLFIYYNERVLENDILQDAGASLTDGIKTLEKYGVCPETMWPYDITKFAVKPTDSCYTEALNYTAITVANIQQNEQVMKSCLASGFPFVVGINIYTSFESDNVSMNGIVPMPNIQTEVCLGGHAIVCVGYNETQWIMRNSWGIGWGDKGYFYLPYQYLLDSTLSSDLWDITKIKNH